MSLHLPQEMGCDDNMDSDCALNSGISPIGPQISPVQGDAEAHFGTGDESTNATDGEQGLTSTSCYDFYS